MVSVRSVIWVISLVALAAFANPAPGLLTTPLEVANSLLKRASAPQFDLSAIPAQCQSACKDANGKIAGCSNDSCFCKDANLQSFGACLSCVVADPSSTTVLDKDTAQSSMDVLTGVCNKEGFKVKDVKIGAPSGAARSAVLSSKALAGIALGAFVLA
ncbi:hypothetical protein DXG01_007094 [Tephrocybe rancida]|nr:hypothetical protein DXG01_007094 [Tephrocybe rancida]